MLENMRHAPLRAAAAIAAVAALAACGGDGDGDDARDDRAPDATGTVETVEDVAGGVELTFAPDPGGEYYDGARLRLAYGGGLQDADGAVIGTGDVAAGDRIAIWTDECAESFPVQCSDVLARLEE